MRCPNRSLVLLFIVASSWSGGCGQGVPATSDDGAVAPPDLGLQQVRGSFDPCALAGVDWTWANSAYTHIPSEPGYKPGNGAGLKDNELVVGGDDDEYDSYMRFSLPPGLAGFTLSKFEVVFQTFPDSDVKRTTTAMELHSITADWATEELEPGYTGVRWVLRPQTAIVAANIPAPKAGSPYTVDLLPVMHDNSFAFGFALLPVNTNGNFNHFVSCGATKPSGRS